MVTRSDGSSIATRSAKTAANRTPAETRTGVRRGRRTPAEAKRSISSRMRPGPRLRASGGVGRGAVRPDQERAVVEPRERLDDARVELAAGLRQDLVDGALQRPRLLVR